MRDILKRVEDTWKNLNQMTKWILPTVLLAFIFIASIYMFAPNKYETLYTGLDDYDSFEIQQHLSGKGIDYKMESGNEEILVDGDVNLIKRDLALLGLPKKPETSGLSKFDDLSIGSTKFDKEVQYQARLQKDLEYAIETAFTNIDKANVQLPKIKEKSIFDDENSDIKISVVVKARGNEALTQENVEAIQLFVAASIQDVDSNNVEILDSHMNVLSGQDKNNKGTAITNELKIIEETKRKIETDLETVLSGVYGRVKVIANIDINFDEIVQNIETYDPEGTLLSTESSSEREFQTNEEDLNIVGVDENGEVPGYQIENLNEENITYHKDKEHLIENFSIGKTVEKVIKHPELRNTNVAVWIDSRSGDGTVEELTLEELQGLEEMVAISSGLIGEVQRVENDKSVYQNGSVKVTQWNFFDNVNEVGSIDSEDEVDRSIVSTPLVVTAIAISSLLLILVIVLIIVFVRRGSKSKEGEAIIKEEYIEEGVVNEVQTVEENDSHQLDITVDDETDDEKSIEEKFEFEWNEQQRDLRSLTNEVTRKFPKETADVIKRLLEE